MRPGEGRQIKQIKYQVIVLLNYLAGGTRQRKKIHKKEYFLNQTMSTKWIYEDKSLKTLKKLIILAL